MPDLILSTTFDDDTGSGDGSAGTVPSGWEKADSGNMTVYTGQTDSDLSTNQSNMGWVFGDDHTNSSQTGPGGGMDNDLDATTGTWSTASEHRYMYLESSSNAASQTVHKYHLIRTSAIDLSSYAAGDTIVLKFWFHKYGASHTENHFGIAATTATNDASNASEAGTGLGFTSDTAGGASITFWTAHDGSTTSTAQRITGQQQTSGHTTAQANANLWRLAEADLSAAAGQSTVYIYFLVVTHDASVSYRQDLGIENMQVLATRAPVADSVLLIEDDHDIHTYEVVQARYDIKEVPTSLTSPAPRHLRGRHSAYNLTEGGNK